ncbi:uncharacterized protein TNCV_4225351 [Trichonephila clavipes]|uniref:Uncharacterized protein n=1 Tax=Trichonephila clavipes TaxID=2585209 RepID=A0A8X6SVV2_TRICX|nr:uncharacterized protein TNCV_4225351 [Trichonephila clavipes]
MGAEFLFMDDNARPHRANIADECLKSEDITPTRGLLATDHVILNHGQVTWTTPELESPLLSTTPHQRDDVSALDRFNVHHCPTRRVFSGTGLKLVTRQATIRCLYHSATAGTHDSKNQETWKAIGNPGHCESNPAAPGESRDDCSLSDNHRAWRFGSVSPLT